MPNPTNETFEEEQQRNIKQGSQNQQDIESPREEEHIDDLDADEDTEELSTAEEGDDADLAGGEEEQIGDADDEQSIERSADESANESGVSGGDLDEGNNLREAGQRTDDGRRQADDIDIERNDQPKDDDIEEE